MGQRHAALIDPDRAAHRAIEYLKTQPVVVEGERNHKCFLVANHLKDLGVDAGACLELLQEHWPCQPMLDDAELELAIGSAYRSTRTAPGSAAPETQFSVMSTNCEQSNKVDKTWIRLLLDFCKFR